MSEWQPIKTAPEDDDALILVANSEGTWVAQYRPVYQSGFRPNCPWASMLMNHDHIRFQKSFRPTHWMPLPPPPTETPNYVMPQFKDVLDTVNALSIRSKE